MLELTVYGNSLCKVRLLAYQLRLHAALAEDARIQESLFMTTKLHSYIESEKAYHGAVQSRGSCTELGP